MLPRPDAGRPPRLWRAPRLPFTPAATSSLRPTGTPVPVACAPPGHDMHVTLVIQPDPARLAPGPPNLLALNTLAIWLLHLKPAPELGTGTQAIMEQQPSVQPLPEAGCDPRDTPSSRRPPGSSTAAQGSSPQSEALHRGAAERPRRARHVAAAVDRPIVMAAAAVMRLQTIVSCEIAAVEPAVVTIGSLQADTKGNVIPDEAVLRSTCGASTAAPRAGAGGDQADRDCGAPLLSA